MSKTARLTAAAAFATISLTASGLGASANAATSSFPTVPATEQVSITLASYLPTLGTAGTTELNTLISGFEAAHPNIHVTSQPETNSAAIAATVQQDEVSGTTPDVLQDAFNDLKFTTSQLGAVDLTKLVGAQSVAAAFGGANPFVPAVTKLAQVKGDVYGIPWTLSTPILFYNSSLFAKGGISASEDPTNWAQVQSDAQKIKTATGADGLANGCVGNFASGTDWCLQAIIDSDGGSVMNTPQTALTFNSPRTVAAITTMQGLAKSGLMVNLSSTQAIQEWGAGKLAMVLDTSALASTLLAAAGTNFTIKAVPLPGFGSKAAVPTNSGSALFMMSKSKLKQEADWELMQYLTTAASETSVTENIGYPPLRTDVATNPKYLANYSKTNQFLAPNVAQLPHLKPWIAYPGPNYTQVVSVLTNAVSNVVFEGKDPASTMAAAQTQATGLLK
jgi:multiple sugar transport system substrate-binding protein